MSRPSLLYSLYLDSQTPNRYRTMERGHSGRKDLSVPRYGRKLFCSRQCIQIPIPVCLNLICSLLVWMIITFQWMWDCYSSQPGGNHVSDFVCAIRVLVDLPLSTSCWLIILLLREIGFDFVLIWMFWACVKRAVESGGSTRNSREDLYGSRNYRGSNSSLNDGRFPFFIEFIVWFVSTSYSACCLFFCFFLSPTNFSTFFMFEFIFVSLHLGLIWFIYFIYLFFCLFSM